MLPGFACARLHPATNFCENMHRRCRATNHSFPRKIWSLLCSPLMLMAVLLILMVNCSVAQSPEDLFVRTSRSTFSVHECVRALDTRAQMVYICGRTGHPDAFPILKFAERIAKLECEGAFKDERWNCSGFSLLKAPKITIEANREAAYVHTLSLAVIAHTVARACTEGLLQSCSCDDIELPLPTEQGTTFTRGCSDNIDFGLQFAEAFLVKRYAELGFKERLDQHNIRAGRLLVRSIITSVQPGCRCVGVSGACTFQSCTFDLPEFGAIAQRIKQLYDDACEVRWNGRRGEHFAWDSECGTAVRDHMLLYMTSSPNYCNPNSVYGTLGVRGRECELHSNGPNSCANLCVACGRSYQERTERVENECDCAFHFCCEIRCGTCTTDRTYYTCT